MTEQIRDLVDRPPLPNELRREPTYYEKRDWTDGCIAVSDSDMLEIWLMTPQDTPIDILP